LPAGRISRARSAAGRRPPDRSSATCARPPEPYPARGDATDALVQFAAENARWTWFELFVTRPGMSTVSNFKLVAFSTGEIVGEGSAFVTVVPEPETWALMLTGIGLVFPRARRR
jgi:hypothetical protein